MNMNFFKVSRPALLLFDGFIWTCAGINILRIGIHTWIDGSSRWYLVAALAVAVFLAFNAMFTSIVWKNVTRVGGMEKKVFFWKMMPLKSWIILAFMMTLGITLRSSGIASPFFIAFFYCGLGTALMRSGIKYIVSGIDSYVKEKNN